jgi:hypothetical protein
MMPSQSLANVQYFEKSNIFNGWQKRRPDLRLPLKP